MAFMNLGMTTLFAFFLYETKKLNLPVEIDINKFSSNEFFSILFLISCVIGTALNDIVC